MCARPSPQRRAKCRGRRRPQEKCARRESETPETFGLSALICGLLVWPDGPPKGSTRKGSGWPLDQGLPVQSTHFTPGNAEEDHTRYRARNRRDVPRLMLPSGTTKCNQVIRDANFVSILQEAKCEFDFSVD